MTIHFFVGSEFSSSTDFQALNQASQLIQRSTQELIFYSAWEKNLDLLAEKFQPGDVIIGASAGGTAAAELVKKVIALGKPQPLVIGFEAVGGLGSIADVISIVQAENPKDLRYDNHYMYQLQDNTHEMVNGRKRYVYGHAFYAVHPHFVDRLQYKPDSITRINDSEYVLIPEASLTIESKTYHYKNLIAKTSNNQSLQLDIVNCRVFQLELINNLVSAAMQNKLDEHEVIPGLQLAAISSPRKKRSKQGDKKDELAPFSPSVAADTKKIDPLISLDHQGNLESTDLVKDEVPTYHFSKNFIDEFVKLHKNSYQSGLWGGFFNRTNLKPYEQLSVQDILEHSKKGTFFGFKNRTCQILEEMKVVDKAGNLLEQSTLNNLYS